MFINIQYLFMKNYIFPVNNFFFRAISFWQNIFYSIMLLGIYLNFSDEAW